MRSRSCLVLLALCAGVHAQAESRPADPDAVLAAEVKVWDAAWKEFVTASAEARKAGRIAKGQALPDDLQKAQAAAEAKAAAIVARHGKEQRLAAASYLALARVEETSRHYRSAVDFYAMARARGDAGAPDTGVMHSLCIAAMNSKDDVLAASWMKRLVDHEDATKPKTRQLAVRTSYYPRTLIALDDWKGLAELVGKLRADETAVCRTAGQKFGLVLALHGGEPAAAEQLVATILGDQKGYPDDQAWAVAVHPALAVRRGDFDAGAARVREYLATKPKEGEKASAVDQNQRRYLAAIEPFLGKPAPRLRVDHWVGGKVEGGDVLGTLAGKVVLLDFWQPWCEPCRKAMPHLVALQAQHREDLAVLGLCKIENYGYDVSEKVAVRPLTPETYPAHVEDFRKDMGITYPLAIAATGDNNTAYAVAGIPTLVVIDRKGIVRYMSCGAGEPGLLEAAVAGVLAAR